MTNILVTVTIALGGAWLFELMNVPAGALIGALVAVAAFRLGGFDSWDVPAAGEFLVYAAAGWLMAQSFSRDTLEVIRGSSIAIIGVVVAFLVVGMAFAVLLWRWTSLDGVTSYLAASPGGLSQMPLIGVEAGADVPIVLSVHLLRVLAATLLTPVVVKVIPSVLGGTSGP